GVHSATTVVSTGAGATKLVLLSMVVVDAPSGRLITVAIAPRVSARAIIAPPWSTAGRVHKSARTSISALTPSAEASMILIPSISANGSGADKISSIPAI